MAHQDTLKAKGRVGIVLKDKDGKVKDKREIDNTVVNAGLAYIASRMVDANDSVMTHMALGESNANATGSSAESQTALGTETTVSGTDKRKLFTSSTTHSGATVTYTCFFDQGESTGSIKEAGIFTAMSGGTMLCRTVFDEVNKAALDTMTVTWTITLSDT